MLNDCKKVNFRIDIGVTMEISLTYFTFFKGGNFNNTASTGGQSFTIHFLRSVLNETFIVMFV